MEIILLSKEEEASKSMRHTRKMVGHISEH